MLEETNRIPTNPPTKHHSVCSFSNTHSYSESSCARLRYSYDVKEDKIFSAMFILLSTSVLHIFSFLSASVSASFPFSFSFTLSSFSVTACNSYSGSAVSLSVYTGRLALEDDEDDGRDLPSVYLGRVVDVEVEACVKVCDGRMDAEPPA